LLNHRHRLEIREDGNGEVVVAGLEEINVTSTADMLSVIDLGNRNRTTHATESNDESSRSHAICQVKTFNDLSYAEKHVIFYISDNSCIYM
jgi:kinesin family protein 2/24